MPETPISVLGGGIMGCCLALALARHGRATILHDQASALLTGASRWNEGKIHLGYLYAASGNLLTARSVMAGGLSFGSRMERLLERDIRPWLTASPDHYLLHRDSLVDRDRAQHYFRAVDALLASSAPAAFTPSDRLSAAALEAITGCELIADGWRVPEVSVNTQALADALAARVLDDPLIETRCNSRITSVQPLDSGGFRITDGDGHTENTSIVCNALWAGRPAIDLSCLGKHDENSHFRYRVAAFVEAENAPDVPSAVLGFGPFGDVKSYGEGRYYISWYPAGLVAEGQGATPPSLDPTRIDQAAIAQSTRIEMSRFLPGVDGIFANAKHTAIAGGWVYARGRGQISDTGASIHRRDKWGVLRSGNYLSIDTGKYSVAPWLADRIAAQLCG